MQLALQVLECVAFAGESLGVTEIAERVGATKSSVHRHLLTFVERGYLVQDAESSHYSLGAKSRLLARMAPEADLMQLSERAMHNLRDTLGHSVVLSATTPRGAFVITTVASRLPIEIGVRPGSELSFHASAQGRVLLAHSPRPLQQRVLAQDLPALTPKTVVDRDRIEAEIVKVAKRGYAAAPEQVLLGINAIAAPIFDRNDNCVASIAIVGSIQHLPEKEDAATIAALKACAQQISRELGHGRDMPDVVHLDRRRIRGRTA